MCHLELARHEPNVMLVTQSQSSIVVETDCTKRFNAKLLLDSVEKGLCSQMLICEATKEPSIGCEIA